MRSTTSIDLSTWTAPDTHGPPSANLLIRQISLLMKNFKRMAPQLRYKWELEPNNSRSDYIPSCSSLLR
ncbi:hypothetical protein SERLA73DRAFT_190717 [Serpula lacrymans var. lacrymans S7.3]|uniref:Uncharacterized protein n=2 Tax=Serpula lacrymans var. lacrymans TaxID=341189 RepID=F8QG82_SERL3|nr:uncharacterized protein SERLADRAFT_478842 [Serpula lacrymans var. lacrymans S7.9]EGN92697.1 hypothetical protein SERLA73DRAFT_190717 [Serpula lacrymans var. lacrymans S7.3]EGO19439.1 hypothetical protein SERLADRAFT_478842 [Serpula lacrymans var. lacrymans S7.9]